MKSALLGYGTVGKGVEELINTIPGLENKYVFVLPEFVEEPYFTNDGIKVVTDPEVDIVFECMSGTEPANTLITEALAHGKHVISSNKATLSPNIERYLKLADENGGSIQIEAAVAGGIPFMDALLKLSLLEDLDGYEGIFNGTSNYILDSMQKDAVDYEKALEEAQEHGYAEANPENDVEGWDVWYKTNLANALAYGSCKQELKKPIGISRISLNDIDMAKEKGKVIRHISTSRQKDGAFYSIVAPVFLEKEDYLANVPANYNAQLIYGKSFEKLGYFGQGAGRYPTAQAMAANALDVLYDTIRPIKADKDLTVDPDLILEDWIVRSVADLSGLEGYQDKETYDGSTYYFFSQQPDTLVDRIYALDPDAMIALWRN